MGGEEVFRSGTLEMSAAPWEGLVQEPLWADLTVNRVLCVAAVVLVVIDLLDYLRLVPHLLYTYDRSRGAETLEHSIGTSRSRNAAAFIQAIPFCLVLDRYAVVRPAFWSGIPAAWSAPATIGLVAAFLLVRRLLYAFFRPRRLSGESFDALRHNLYNYLLLLVPLLLLTVAVLTPAHVPDTAGRRILTGEIIAVWAFALVRSGQILGAHGSGLSTFLYLCGLELLPAALLAAVVVFF